MIRLATVYLTVCGLPIKPGSKRICTKHFGHYGSHEYVRFLKNIKSLDEITLLVQKKKLKIVNYDYVNLFYFNRVRFDVYEQLDLLQPRKPVPLCLIGIPTHKPYTTASTTSTLSVTTNYTSPFSIPNLTASISNLTAAIDFRY